MSSSSSSSKTKSPLSNVTASSRAAARSSSRPAPGAPRYGDGDDVDLEAFARFFVLGLQSCCGRLRLGALTALAFHADLPRRLWAYVAATQMATMAASLDGYFSAGRAAPSPPPRGVVVCLACVALLRHALLIADDDELRDRRRPLALFQLRTVAATLRPGLFAYCWRSEASHEARLGVDEAATWVATLLHDLHARSCRRPLAKQSLWLVPEADDRRVSDELRSGTTKRSKRLLTLMPFALPFRERARLFAHRVRPEGGSNARAEEVRFFDENAARNRTVVRVRRSHASDGAVIQRHFNMGVFNALVPG